ncbi:hypothetical protein TSAR_007839 [Trichomalopsis sarcophagae]|uniref:DNA/RNA non-specific endonuclease/pyrophosphatase/phosphodiesterase domain-containing protein n=1 Tax=Trichomalopsis sarcophagae TaxID=543379 RepID=A0A232FN35_9HYME|nr:hypothetical protein TSAR_007839 [Trichomalopsis sarcophagae]
MYCSKKKILFLALFVIIQLAHAFQQTDVTDVQNVTLHRSKRMLGDAKDPSMVLLKQKFFTGLLTGLTAITCNYVSEPEVKTCTINVKTLRANHALLIEPFDRTQFRYPDENGFIHMTNGEPIFLTCPGENNKFEIAPLRQFMLATCVCGQTFAPEVGHPTEFSAFTCEQPPESAIVFIENYGREGVLSKYEIGFYTENDYFLKLMDIHYDNLATSTMYVKSMISKWIAGSQKTPKNRRFDQTYCCGTLTIDMDNAYNIDVQDVSFGKQMNCHLDRECNFFDKSKGIVFNRGHLTPKSTFVYTAAGVATFRYINSAPQYKPVNDGNWARMEEHIVELAAKLKKDLVTITGVLGILKLVDTADFNTEKFIHLYKTDNMRAMQVPLYFYKLVHDPLSNKGIVYVTVNNPFLKMDELSNYQICAEPMFKIPGGKVPPRWKPKSIGKGYSYICKVSDFVTTNVVNFDVTELENVNVLLYESDSNAASTSNDVEQPTTQSHLLPRDELK